LKAYSRVAVAFSGGVDSSLLLYAARDAIGMENVIVLRGLSELVSSREESAASALLTELAVSENLINRITLHPLIWPEFKANTDDRCYFCKKRMYQTFQRELESFDDTPLLDGSNMDDLKSHRPGFRAIHELGVKTPLLDAGLNKDDIRGLTRSFGISSHDKISNSCLATRLAYGTVIEKAALKQIERCEDFLLSRKFYGCRVKPNGSDVILELNGNDAERLTRSNLRIEIMHFFQFVGFSRVLIDLKPRQ